ncbi:phage tail protein [Paracoccus litorisediminis]|nr:phage tail protein [Paracoccus litorisediminis]
MTYPYDRDHLDRMAGLLYALIPEFHKRRDRTAAASVPPEAQELRAMVEALAAPLAAIQQSIEELYADFFVETAGEAMLPGLAAAIGLDPAFRDPEANRRDLAAAMGWRRRKGTPAMLEEMGRVLLDRQVALAEGWKSVMLVQDLNLIRTKRIIAGLRPASVAERAQGPLSNLMRLIDPRPIGPDSGHVHPLHLVHWAFPTRLYPLTRAACHELPPGAGDRRFAFDADDAWRALRVRATGFDDRPGTDRVPDGLFAESPGDWFGREGRFSIRLTGVPAAASPPDAPILRNARRIPADNALGRSPAEVTLIAADTARYSGEVAVMLVSAPLAGALPDLAQAVDRGGLGIGPAGAGAALPGAGNVASSHVMLLRLSPTGAASSRMVGETVISVAGSAAIARRAATAAELAQSGYARGALYLRIPERRVTGDVYFWIGADGSLHELLALEGGDLPARALVSAPVGPVWPETAETAERPPFAPSLVAPGAAPALLHGAEVLRANSAGLIGAGVRNALVLALGYFAGQRRFSPMLRLRWNGPDPRTAQWQAVGADGAPIAAAGLAAHLAGLARLAASGPSDLALTLRFESSVPGAIMVPGELAFTAHDGSAVLVHLPELAASQTLEAAPDGSGFWPRGPAPLTRHSVAVQLGADGSTWLAGTTRLMRRGLGNAAPLLDPRPLRRRQAGWRRLCPWQNETAVDKLEPTRPARLDIDPRFGLFALNGGDQVVPHPPGMGVPPPGPVSVDMQMGATMPLGALPLDHRRHLGLPLPPTRLVSNMGHLGPDATPDLLDLPLHRSLHAALQAAGASGLEDEIIEIRDCGFYGAEALDWPAGPARLEIRAAPLVCPVIQIASSTPGAAGYARLRLAGLALTREGLAEVTLDLPPAQQVEMDFLTVLRIGITLRAQLLEAAGAERMTLRRCLLGPLRIDDPGELLIEDSILSAGNDTSHALDAALIRTETSRVTIAGRLEAREVELSDTIVTGTVLAHERFRGCLRYCLIAPGSLTPRRHRVLDAEPTGRPIRAPFESRDRRDPAFLRLDAGGDARVLHGASDGGEIGAFNAATLGELQSGLARRLAEHTPAGLRAGIVTRP